MATIHKLTKDGSTIFPATITDAIVHPNTGKTLTSMIKDYNVSELFPSEGLDDGNRYNLALAIQVLGSHLTAAEKTGGVKITFISSVSPYPEEEYYLNKNTWSTTLSDWGQRFEVGDVIANPSGSWEPGTAEQYIDQQTAILSTNLASETLGRQTVDSNLQAQINAEVSNRTAADNIQNERIGVLEEIYQSLTESDVIVGARPSSDQQANVIYREPDQGHTPPQFYCDYMWYDNAWVLMAQYDNGIDNDPLPNSNNLVKSSGVFNNMSAFDISVYNSGAIYQDLTNALSGVPNDMKVGGVSVKFIQETSPKEYSVVKTEGLTTEPTGTELSTDPNIISGTYSDAQLNNLDTVSALPSTLNSSKTYYFEVSGGTTTYTKWVVTYVQDAINKYQQYRLKSTNWSTIEDDWVGNLEEELLYLERCFGKYDTKREIALTKAISGKYVNTSGKETSLTGYGISGAIEILAGDILLIPSATAVPAEVSVVSRVVTRTYDKVIVYTYTYDEDDKYVTATADYDNTLVYTAVYDESGEAPVLTGWTRNGTTYETLPVTHEVSESYYEPLVKQSVSAMPSTGYYVYLCPANMSVIISGLDSTVSGGVCLVVGWGIFKNICTNFVGAPGQSVIAQAFAAQQAEIEGLKAQLRNLGDAKAKTIDAENGYLITGQKQFDLVSGAPTEIPMAIGLVRFDASTGALYISKAVTGSTGDWKIVS